MHTHTLTTIKITEINKHPLNKTIDSFQCQWSQLLNKKIQSNRVDMKTRDLSFHCIQNNMLYIKVEQLQGKKNGTV